MGDMWDVWMNIKVFLLFRDDHKVSVPLTKHLLTKRAIGRDRFHHKPKVLSTHNLGLKSVAKNAYR